MRYIVYTTQKIVNELETIFGIWQHRNRLIIKDKKLSMVFILNNESYREERIIFFFQEV